MNDKNVIKREKLVLQDLEDVEIVPVPWLIAPYVIQGAGTLISGAPGTGKSTFCGALAAALSRGEDLDGRKIDAGPQKIMYLEMEEDPAWIIRPALEANGVAGGMVKLPVKSKMDGSLTLADPDIVDQAVAAGCTVIVISPLTSFFGAISMNDATAVKPILQGFLDRCADAGVSTVFIHHTAKSAAVADISSPAGSAQIAGTFRLLYNVYAPVDRFDDGNNYRWIAPIKCNVGTPHPPAICAWSMAPDATGIPRVMRWLGATADRMDDVRAGVAGPPQMVENSMWADFDGPAPADDEDIPFVQVVLDVEGGK